jgi:fused signal recognition particle receptor
VSWFSKVKESLGALFQRRGGLLAEDWESLQVLLLEGDLGPVLAEELLEGLRKGLPKSATLEEAMAELRATLRAVIPSPVPLQVSPKIPSVYLFTGVNGAGKTTSIAKLAAYLKVKGLRSLLVGGDTFRAAAGEQLNIWADRLGLPFISHQMGGDPSAVVFDAMEMATSKGFDAVLVDTAGRQQTKHNLMEELKKIRRTVTRKKADAPDEVFLTLDANSGLNALSQVESFHRTMGLTGLILTKFDSPARAGFLFPILQQLAIPVKFVGSGEKVGDWQIFDPEGFLDKFLS